MEILTLEQLKAENAKTETETETEAAELDTEIQAEAEEQVNEEVEAVEVEETEAEEGSEETAEIESWMKSDSQDDEPKFQPNSEAAKRRRQNRDLKGKVKEQESELEALRRKVDEMQNGVAQPVVEEDKPLVRPTREQFDYDDEAYDVALERYFEDKMERKLSSHSQSANQKAQEEAEAARKHRILNENIDSHYEAANKLVDSGAVSAELYRTADANVRRKLDAVSSGNGDALADNIIATLRSLGEGSDKVMYMLGVNDSKMATLTSHMQTNELAAVAYLGTLLNEVQSPNKRKTAAPKPGTKLKGSGGKSDEDKMRKKYQASKDIGERISLKRAAKQSGVDVSNW